MKNKPNIFFIYGVLTEDNLTQRNSRLITLTKCTWNDFVNNNNNNNNYQSCIVQKNPTHINIYSRLQLTIYVTVGRCQKLS